MIGAMIYILCVGCIMLMGIAYTAVMVYCIGRRIWRRRKFEPTESIDKVEGEE